MRWLPALALAVVLDLVAPAAQAELWAFVDNAGVAHFAAQRLDDRYQPVMSVGARPQRVPGKTDHGRSLLTWLEFAPEVKAVLPYLREASQQTGVDMELLKAMIAVESGFKADVISPRGATGLMQITAIAAEQYATPAEARQPVEQRLRAPRSNVLLGARMLADLIKRYGRIDAALAAWNAGETAVRKAGGRMPPIDETQAHVQMVLELYWALLQRSQSQQLQGMQFHSAPVSQQ